MASAGEAKGVIDARRFVSGPLSRTIVRMIEAGEIGSECAICGADVVTWFLELRPMKHATMEAALPELREMAALHRQANTLWGNWPKTLPN